MKNITDLFTVPIAFKSNLIELESTESALQENQSQTKDIFSDKWEDAEKYDDIETLYKFQYDWFLNLYGFGDTENLRKFLADKKYIIDTGCGLGYKAAWFAELAPHAIVLGVDISNSIHLAAKNFSHLKNLYFFKGDISDTKIKANSIDFTVCDQVIMHTENPENTFGHLSDITKKGGEFACYVYRKKAVPRELVDDYFRSKTHNIPSDKMWEFSEQLTVLGETLTKLNVSFECPDIPVLGIKGGQYDIQRFIYWNFLKCFYREDWSFDLNKSCNFDWYAPSNAKRFSKEEFLKMAETNQLETSFMHEEEACYSARFIK